MNTRCLIKSQKRLMEIAFFAVVMGLSFYMIARGQDLPLILHSIGRMSVPYVCAAGAAAIFFVSAEGMMIYDLLHALDGRSSLSRCISYSFIGFFYSGITPSATGGQPMQLYYMKKDGNSLADSSVVLMVVALIYKFVLVIIGVGLLVFWNAPLKYYLRNYFGLYVLGLTLNLVLVVLLSEVMIAPDVMKRILVRAEKLLEKRKLCRISEKRHEKITGFVDSYQDAVRFLKSHKKKILVIISLTFLQRCSVFFLTYIVYRGFHLQGTDLVTIVWLQACVYIAVDMLPVPGAQGITELMYRSVFRTIFPNVTLTASMYVTRGISFYFLLMVSAAVVIGNRICRKTEQSSQVLH